LCRRHSVATFCCSCSWCFSCSKCGNILTEFSVHDWVWDSQWLTDDPACLCDKHTHTNTQIGSSHNTGDWYQLTGADSAGDRYHLAAALGHNSVTLCCWWTRSILQHVCCSESCILYLFRIWFWYILNLPSVRQLL